MLYNIYCGYCVVLSKNKKKKKTSFFQLKSVIFTAVKIAVYDIYACYPNTVVKSVSDSFQHLVKHLEDK